MQSFLPLIILGVGVLLALGIIWYIVTRFLVNIGAKEVGIKERRYFGRRMPQGRVVATDGEVGLQADILKPGLHFVMYPVERVVQKVPLVEIGADELGVIEAIDGEPMPMGSIFAPDRAQNAHNNFQDPIAFIKQGGVKGIQLRTLPPGKWAIHPYLFRVSIAQSTVVPPGKVGVITAADGSPLDQGRLHGKAIEHHKNFQDAEAFIYNGGQKGPQVEILTPGTYRIHTQSTSAENGNETMAGLFNVRMFDATMITENQIGLVEALDGSPLDPKDYVAMPVTGHDNFQDSNAFITAGGQRGQEAPSYTPTVTAWDKLPDWSGAWAMMGGTVFDRATQTGQGGLQGRAEQYQQHGANASTLLRNADIAMYVAKRNKTGTAVYEAGYETHQQQHLSLLSDIRHAVEGNELRVFYQPKISMDSSAACAVEALLRWEHPTRGFIPPAEFIPFAEHTGYIKVLTRWVLEESIRQCGIWRAQGLALRVSVNISTRDLMTRELPDIVSQLLEKYRSPAEMLCLEITESGFMDDPAHALRILEQLHEIGVQLSIDDYGTGYSSLSYIARLPVDELKIDRSFVMRMTKDDTTSMIVRSTIELGHSLGLKVVAEGVEDEASFRFLRELGCDQAQGYFMSRPLPAAGLEEWLRNSLWGQSKFEPGSTQRIALIKSEKLKEIKAVAKHSAG